jgi:hypothetical protein
MVAAAALNDQRRRNMSDTNKIMINSDPNNKGANSSF